MFPGSPLSRGRAVRVAGQSRRTLALASCRGARGNSRWAGRPGPEAARDDDDLRSGARDRASGDGLPALVGCEIIVRHRRFRQQTRQQVRAPYAREKPAQGAPPQERIGKCVDVSQRNGTGYAGRRRDWVTYNAGRTAILWHGLPSPCRERLLTIDPDHLFLHPNLDADTLDTEIA